MSKPQQQQQHQQQAAPSSIWFCNNEDKWSCIEDRIVFHVPLEEVPDYVIEDAEAYHQTCVNSHKRMEIIHAMGLSGMDEEWD